MSLSATERARALLGANEDSRFGDTVRERLHARVSESLAKAELTSAETKLLTRLCTGIFIVAAASSAVLFSVIPLIAGTAFCYVVMVVTVQRKARARSRAFDADFPSFLMALVSSIRSGLDPVSAFIGAGDLFPSDSVLRIEVSKVRDRLNSGDSEDAAFKLFGAVVAHPDAPLLISAFSLARREGGSLGDALERLTRVARQRQSFRRKTRAAVALQRISSIAIALIAVAILLLQLLTNTSARGLLFNTGLGQGMLAVGMSLILMGVIGMFRISRIKV